MELETNTVPMVGAIGNGEVDRKAVAAHFYQTSTISATDLAVAVIGARFGLSASIARLVVELSGLGRARV